MKIPEIIKAPEIFTGLIYLVFSLAIVPLPLVTRADYYASLELTLLTILGGIIFLISYFVFRKK